MVVHIPNIEDNEPSNEGSSPYLKVSVPPEGSLEYARFALVGEAPGSQEMNEKRPFVGMAGNLLNRILNVIRLPRHELYITNFCKTKLPKNDAKHLNPVWEHLRYNLIQELAQLKSDYIILMGETAMKGLFSDPKFDKITKFQGSVYEAEEFPELAEPLKGKKILLTLHPASALPNAKPSNFYVIMNDLLKMIDLEANPDQLNVTNKFHTGMPYPEAVELLNKVLQVSETAFDIEATPDFETCVGFTITPYEAVTIPFLDGNGSFYTLEQETHLWKLIASILESPSIKKIMQNGMFDTLYELRKRHIKVENFAFDTMLASHLCWTDLSKGLDALVARYTFYPYYKDEGKEVKLGKVKDWQTHWFYNAKDCCYTHQVVPHLEKELSDISAWETYNHLMELHKPLIEMSYRGIKVNTKGLRTERDKLYKHIGILKNALARVSGEDLNPNSTKLQDYFYGKLGIKPYKNLKTGRPTLDDTALKRIARANKRGHKEAKIIRRIRKLGKLVSNYFDVNLDSDSRLRCDYKISGTSTGRLSSSATFFGTGTNMQNLDPRFKKYLVPDDDYLMIEVDLSQAEARVVAYVSGDANMMQSFEAGIDCHSYNACQIFHWDMNEFLSELQAGNPKAKNHRKLAKRIVHASNYSMGYKTFSLQLEIPENEAKSLLEAYHNRFPGLKKWHRQIEQKIYKDRTLHNLFGRPKRFLGNIDMALLRGAFAYIPQSTVAEQLNRGMVKIYDDPDLDMYDLQLLGTVHDSILFQIYKPSPEDVHFVLNRCSEHLDIPLYANGREFHIPCDAKIGYKNWKSMTELKEFSMDSIRQTMKELNSNGSL